MTLTKNNLGRELTILPAMAAGTALNHWASRPLIHECTERAKALKPLLLPCKLPEVQITEYEFGN